MSKKSQTLLSLALVALSYAMGGVGWSVPLTPYWLNTVLFTAFVPCFVIGIIWFIRALKM